MISRNRAATAKKNLPTYIDAIQEAIEKKYVITLMMDDYHNIHSIRRPSDDRTTSKVNHMCTIIIKIVKEATAIPFNSVDLIHNPRGIHANLLLTNLCSDQFFNQICSFSFGSSMPELTRPLFDPLMARHQMESHERLPFE